MGRTGNGSCKIVSFRVIKNYVYKVDLNIWSFFYIMDTAFAYLFCFLSLIVYSAFVTWLGALNKCRTFTFNMAHGNRKIVWMPAICQILNVPRVKPEGIRSQSMARFVINQTGYGIFSMHWLIPIFTTANWKCSIDRFLDLTIKLDLHNSYICIHHSILFLENLGSSWVLFWNMFFKARLIYSKKSDHPFLLKLQTFVSYIDKSVASKP